MPQVSPAKAKTGNELPGSQARRDVQFYVTCPRPNRSALGTTTSLVPGTLRPNESSTCARIAGRCSGLRSRSMARWYCMTRAAASLLPTDILTWDYRFSRNLQTYHRPPWGKPASSNLKFRLNYVGLPPGATPPVVRCLYVRPELQIAVVLLTISTPVPTSLAMLEPVRNWVHGVSPSRCFWDSAR